MPTNPFSSDRAATCAYACSALIVVFVALVLANAANARRLAGSAPAATAMADVATAKPTELTLPQWKQLEGQPNTIVVDVRSRHDFADGHLPGSYNIPIHEITSRGPNELPREATIVVYCGYNKKCETSYAKVGVLTPCVEVSTALRLQYGFKKVFVLAVEKSELVKAGAQYESFDYDARHALLNRL